MGIIMAWKEIIIISVLFWLSVGLISTMVTVSLALFAAPWDLVVDLFLVTILVIIALRNFREN